MMLPLAWLAANAVLVQAGATVSVTVLNSASQEPVPKTMVILRSRDLANGTSYAAESTGTGAFRIPNVVPGTYTLTADRQGFNLLSDVAEGEAPRPITIEAGKDLALTLKMVPLCVISGHVVDEEGDPVRHVSVRALRYAYLNGKRQLVGTIQAQTDDRGAYRLFGLAAGKFYVQAQDVQMQNTQMQRMGVRTEPSPPTEAHMAYVPTFFPSADLANAATQVNLAPGGEALGIDIKLRKLQVYSVRGTVPALNHEPQGRGPQRMGYMISLVPVDHSEINLASLANLNSYRINTSDSVSTFEIPNVPPGSYILAARKTADGQSSYARQPVEVGGANVNGLNLTLTPGLDVTGRVVFEGSGVHPLDNIQVRLTPFFNQGNTPVSKTGADGTFTLHDVAPDDFEVTVMAGGDSYFKNIRVGDRVITSHHLDVTQGTDQLRLVLATDLGDIEGAVKDAQGGPASGVRVTAIPIAANLGRMELSRFAFTDTAGNYHIKNLPPGDYKLFAWDHVQVGAPQDPEFRAPYEKQGTEIKLASEGHQTVVLTLIHVTEP